VIYIIIIINIIYSPFGDFHSSLQRVFLAKTFRKVEEEFQKVEEEFGKVVQLLVSEIVSYT
jgi:hypothetical protein